MYDDYAAAFDDAEERFGGVAGYMVMFFHADGSMTVDAVTDEGSEAAEIVNEMVKAFEEPAH